MITTYYVQYYIQRFIDVYIYIAVFLYWGLWPWLWWPYGVHGCSHPPCQHASSAVIEICYILWLDFIAMPLLLFF